MCAKMLNNKMVLKDHKKECEGHKLFLHRCENCGKTDGHKGNHMAHVKSCLVKKPLFSSANCVRKLSLMQEIWTFMRRSM